MKRNMAIALTAVMALICANTVFASEVFTKAHSDMAKADLSGLTAKYADAIDEEFTHAEPMGFVFVSGVVSAKTGDFDGDGETKTITITSKTEKAEEGFAE